jgi:NCAIR mutase (PurE)-related protein
MNAARLHELLESVRRGSVSVDEAVAKLRDLPFEDAGVAMIDHHRHLRQGASEVVFGENKTVEQIVTITERMLDQGHDVLVTRLAADKAERVGEAFSDGEYDALGRTWTLARHRRAPRRYASHADADAVGRADRGGAVPAAPLVVCAGTSDLPVAREAMRTLEFFGHAPTEIVDAGVAGLHLLLAHSKRLRDASVVIVVAGMEGALPSVVGGLVSVPVIAVPTSVGYGAAFDGIAALLGMLNSCAAGLTVVNIDNGFGAAFAAHRILASAHAPGSARG